MDGLDTLHEPARQSMHISRIEELAFDFQYLWLRIPPKCLLQKMMVIYCFVKPQGRISVSLECNKDELLRL